MDGCGMVFWVTGLSGAGKTTIGSLLYEHIRRRRDNAVFLDGDALREVFGDDLGYTRQDRLKSAMRNARLCALLSQQGIHVVCCTISMFHSVRNWNRDNTPGYREIYIKVPADVLARRNQKGLYSGGIDVAGVDLVVEEPDAPDVEVCNDGKMSPNSILNIILKELGL